MLRRLPGRGPCEAGFECRSYNSGDIQLCVPDEVRVSHTQRYKSSPRSQLTARGMLSRAKEGRLEVTVYPELERVLSSDTFSIVGMSTLRKLVIGVAPQNATFLKPAADSLVASVTGDAARDVRAAAKANEGAHEVDDMPPSLPT